MIHDYQSILNYFSVLGEPLTDFKPAKFAFFLAPGWQSPSFSPLVLLPGESLERADLDQLEAFIRQRPIDNPALNRAPYFNFFAGENLYDLDALQAVCDEAGWVIDPDPLNIDFLDAPMAVHIPPGIEVTVFDVGKSGLSADYRTVIRRNFKADDGYLEAVERLYQNADANSFTALIRLIDGTTIGGGTVSIRNQLGFLTWGAVNDEFRNQGFHRLLISSCLMVAMSHGANRCALTTRNKLIRGKWDRSVHLFICRKSS